MLTGRSSDFPLPWLFNTFFRDILFFKLMIRLWLTGKWFNYRSRIEYPFEKKGSTESGIFRSIEDEKNSFIEVWWDLLKNSTMVIFFSGQFQWWRIFLAPPMYKTKHFIQGEREKIHLTNKYEFMMIILVSMLHAPTTTITTIRRQINKFN